jgi:LmbE family N-acetylglucosaminyl deacetylase
MLAVVAHPDDEVLGCGGTLARAADEGHDVKVLLPTRRCDPRGVTLWPALIEGFRRSCAMLGATAVVPDDPLSEIDADQKPHALHDLILPWVEATDTVLTHWPGDVNQVHRGVARAVEIATRPFRRRRDVSLFEIPTSTDQIFGVDAARAFLATEYVVLTPSQARRKCEALGAYPSEVASGRSVDDVERRMRMRGAEIGVELAEAFVVARRFR